MKPWDREDTRTWIANLTNKLEDFGYYKAQAIEWCENNNVCDTETITLCVITALLWVTSMRLEEISFGELCDLIGAVDVANAMVKETMLNPDDTIGFKDGFADAELEVLLQDVVNDKLRG